MHIFCMVLLFCVNPNLILLWSKKMTCWNSYFARVCRWTAWLLIQRMSGCLQRGLLTALWLYMTCENFQSVSIPLSITRMPLYLLPPPLSICVILFISFTRVFFVKKDQLNDSHKSLPEASDFNSGFWKDALAGSIQYLLRSTLIKSENHAMPLHNNVMNMSWVGLEDMI